MLPIYNPPNAILLATGQIKKKEIFLSGLLLVIVSGLVISFAMFYWGSYVFGIK